MDKSHVIYGPPGTGKTTEIVKILTKAVNLGTPTDKIGIVSFTKAAAKELSERVELEVSKSSRFGHVGTLHSLAYKVSGTIRDQVVDYRKLAEFSDAIKIDIRGANPEDSEHLTEGDEYLALHQYSRAKLDPSYDYTYNRSHRPGSLEKFIYFCESFDKWKSTNGYVDFNDMLIEAMVNDPPEFDLIFIDESQDLSNLQWRLIDKWLHKFREVYIAGDDDQSIYTWGGADERGMQKFQKAYNSNARILSQSHRIPPEVHRLANGLIKRISGRVEKEYLPKVSKGLGGKVSFLEELHLLDLDPISHGNDILILYRNHHARKDVEDYLIEKGLPYLVDGGKLGILQSQQCKMVNLWKRMFVDLPFHYSEKEMTLHMDTFRLSSTDLDMIQKYVSSSYKYHFDKGNWGALMGSCWTEALNVGSKAKSYLWKIQEEYGLLVHPTIHLSTIHGSKGREAERVILINSMSERTAEAYSKDPNSEIRTFYVGVTRSKYQLDVIRGNNPLPIEGEVKFT